MRQVTGYNARAMDPLDEYLARHAARFEDELKQLLRIPSVSADSRHAADVRRAADFVAADLDRSGLEVETVATAGHPLVVGSWLGAPGKPTLLIYGHYDVQPPDPLDLWISPPFEPSIRDGNLYARGATDDKGQMFTYLKALEARLAVEGRLPINVKVLIEGEEEVGSGSIEAYLPGHADSLACDWVAISDTCQLGPDQPALTYGLRGLSYFELKLTGPRRDLHSGTFGGSVENPINALATILAALRGTDGRITLPGFYDDVDPPAATERAEWSRLPFDEAAYRAELGVPALAGEEGFSTLERRWTRPTCDINGITGGYQGEGAKTVLPAWASAKVSFRLVPRQDPRAVDAAFRAFVQDYCPAGVRAEVVTYQGSRAIVVPLGGDGIRAAARALERGFGKSPHFIREGGSIPIVSAFKRVLGVDSLLLGYGLPDDNTHSPNEKIRLADFHRGIRTSAYLLDELAKVTPKGNGCRRTPGT